MHRYYPHLNHLGQLLGWVRPYEPLRMGDLTYHDLYQATYSKSLHLGEIQAKVIRLL